MIIKIINFLVFQFGWIVVIYLHNQNAAVICLLLAMLNYVITKQYYWRYVMAIICVTFLGVLNDFVLLRLGMINFPDQEPGIFPLWLVALWCLFVSTFASSLEWLRGKSLIALASLGGLGGAMSYYSGTVAGAMRYDGGMLPQLLLHFINWFLLFPLLSKIFWTIINTDRVAGH